MPASLICARVRKWRIATSSARVFFSIHVNKLEKFSTKVTNQSELNGHHQGEGGLERAVSSRRRAGRLDVAGAAPELMASKVAPGR